MAFFLVNNLLLLNQVPDIRADKTVGRFNVWMFLGAKSGLLIYALFYLLSFFALAIAIVVFALPIQLLLVVLAVPLAYYSVRQAYQAKMQNSKLMPAMAVNVLLNHLMPLLLIDGFWWAA